MALYFIKDTTLKGIADAIRTKTGDSASIPVADFASEIESIVVGDGSSSGGGSGEGDTIIGYEVITKSGTFETGSGATSVTIPHNCGGEPDIVIVYLRRNDLTICGDYTTFVYSTSKINVGNLAITSGYAYQGESGISCSNTTFNVSDLAGNSRYGWYAMKLVDKEISGSGGGDHTVTFMSEDGATWLCEKPVMNGDTCGDPISLGLMEKPTKASTAQYDYTFSGWATSAGGAASSSALVNITADRTVYVAFESEVRYYTVNFYDGETILKTMICEYGTTPSYIPEKAGYMFTGWEPAIVPVTDNADYYAQFVADAIATGACGDNVNWVLGKDGTLTISGTGDMYEFTYGNSPWNSYNSDISTVIIEDGVTSIGSYAFSGCKMTSVSIPDSCTTFGSNGRIFYECTNLVNVSIPNGVMKIPVHTFRETAITSITIPASVSTIMGEAFRSCSSLKSVIFEDTTTWKCWGYNSNYTAKDQLKATLSTELENAETAATYLTNTYMSCDWQKYS